MAKSYTKEVFRDTFKDTFKVAWPSMIEFFFTALVSIIDSLMVSGVGKAAVAAINLTVQPIQIRLTPFTAISIALAALVARRCGEKKRKDTNAILLTAIWLIIGLSVIISVAFFLAADPLIRACGSNADTHDMAVMYFRMIACATPFTTMQMCINSAQRGVGNTKVAMVTHLVSSGVNVILNFLLIEGRFGFPRLEVLGAAIATLVSMFTACVISLLSLVVKKDGFLSFRYIITEKIRATGQALKSFVKLGYSIFIEQVLLRIGFVATAVMAANQGTDALAAHAVGMNLLSLSFAFGDGIQSAAVALIGRALGEQALDRAKHYVTTSRFIGVGISVILGVIYLFFGRWLYQLFFPNPGDENVVEIGIRICYVCIPSLFFQILRTINFGCLHAAGDTRFTAISSIVGCTVIRTLVSLACGLWLAPYSWWPFGGIIGIWFGVFADQFVRYVMTTLRMMSGKWLHIKI